ncbi:DNA gyrase inhibitor YacG [Novosphingobium sp. Leaf2]|uniref:DNA gyrase inhibitor YacG n=1 Tax=Novosphingobium sp. Leaf2 TaxID=1735670 RepID=UPI0009E8CAC9|nr:DNA gyrase inhibitor YacG [Novosphingobium sp. Leaf2]
MTRSERKCPICGKPSTPDHTPFCSKRCRDRDLLQWLGDGYALPGPSAPPDYPDNPQDD